MRLRIVVTALAGFVAILASVCQSHSGAPDGLISLQQQGAKYDSDIKAVRVAIAIENISKSLIVRSYVECVALNKAGKLSDHGQVIFENVHPRETAYNYVDLYGINSTDYNFKCRVSDASL